MKKIVIALLISATFTPAFAEAKTTKQSMQKTGAKIYPMDSFDPNKFSVSNIPEFIKLYKADASPFLKKGEFENTQDYNERISRGFKPKLLNINKIYAFQIDSINIKYNPDKLGYEVSKADSPEFNEFLSSQTFVKLNKESLNPMTYTKDFSESIIRVGKVDRQHNNYVASNAYGKKANVISIKGSDFYIKTLKILNDENEVIKDNQASKEESKDRLDRLKDLLSAQDKTDKLFFLVDVETAKKYSNCNKQVYIFAKLNGQAYLNDSDDYSSFKTPTIDSLYKIEIRRQTIPMDVVGTALKCSNGSLIHSYSFE